MRSWGRFADLRGSQTASSRALAGYLADQATAGHERACSRWLVFWSRWIDRKTGEWSARDS